MKKRVLLLLPLLAGCQDYALNRSQLETNINNVCISALRSSPSSSAYKDCRIYYDKLLLQYGVSPSAPNSWDVHAFARRTSPLANRCASYSTNPSDIWRCVTEQEDIMLAEHIRQKLNDEEMDRRKEMVRYKESARKDREVEVVKMQEEYRAKYRPQPQQNRMYTRPTPPKK